MAAAKLDLGASRNTLTKKKKKKKKKKRPKRRAVRAKEQSYHCIQREGSSQWRQNRELRLRI
jgi:hypothetical protein